MPAIRFLRVPADVRALVHGLYPEITRKVRAGLDELAKDLKQASDDLKNKDTKQAQQSMDKAAQDVRRERIAKECAREHGFNVSDEEKGRQDLAA